MPASSASRIACDILSARSLPVPFFRMSSKAAAASLRLIIFSKSFLAASRAGSELSKPSSSLRAMASSSLDCDSRPKAFSKPATASRRKSSYRLATAFSCGSPKPPALSPRAIAAESTAMSSVDTAASNSSTAASRSTPQSSASLLFAAAKPSASASSEPEYSASWIAAVKDPMYHDVDSTRSCCMRACSSSNLAFALDKSTPWGSASWIALFSTPISLNPMANSTIAEAASFARSAANLALAFAQSAVSPRSAFIAISIALSKAWMSSASLQPSRALSASFCAVNVSTRCSASLMRCGLAPSLSGASLTHSRAFSRSPPPSSRQRSKRCLGPVALAPQPIAPRR
mmetsp:Transcript_70823/g.133854  ORF Transcript_70823/g.133854 Transcript_70823/m.133854 type:complete len:345 (+) Transcript_70823:1076-2110(+)